MKESDEVLGREQQLALLRMSYHWTRTTLVAWPVGIEPTSAE